jgi:GTPase
MFLVVRKNLSKQIPEIIGVPIVGVSAKTNDGMEMLMPAVFRSHRIWNTRISTLRLNKWLRKVLSSMNC